MMGSGACSTYELHQQMANIICRYYLEGLENTNDRIFNIIRRFWTVIDASRFEFNEATILSMGRSHSREMIDIWHPFHLEVVIYIFEKVNAIC